MALEIGAHGVDIDLGGHTIQAAEYVDEEGHSRDEGTGLWNPGYDDVSVVNGSVLGAGGYGGGVVARNAQRLTLRHLVTNAYGSLWVTGDGARISDVTVLGYACSIESSGAVIDNLVATNEVSIGGQNLQIRDSDLNMIAPFRADDSLLVRTTIREGLYVVGDRNSILDNTAEGVWLTGDRNSVLDNEVIGGWLFLRGGSGNSVRGNHVAGWGLVLEPGFSGNDLRDNTASSDFGDGIYVPAGATNNVLTANTASGSSDDGIDVEEPTTILTDNRAFENADLGIEAVLDVADGGGNRAWGNGNPLQCLNVRCGPETDPCAANQSPDCVPDEVPSDETDPDDPAPGSDDPAPSASAPPAQRQPQPPASAPLLPAADTTPLLTLAPLLPAANTTPPPTSTPPLPAADTTPPPFTLAGARRQKLGRALVVTVVCASPTEDCAVSVRGRLRIRGERRTFALAAPTETVRCGRRATIRVTLPRRARAAATRGLRARKRVEAAFTVRAADRAGNESTRALTISLRR